MTIPNNVARALAYACSELGEVMTLSADGTTVSTKKAVNGAAGSLPAQRSRRLRRTFCRCTRRSARSWADHAASSFWPRPAPRRRHGGEDASLAGRQDDYERAVKTRN